VLRSHPGAACQLQRFGARNKEAAPGQGSAYLGWWLPRLAAIRSGMQRTKSGEDAAMTEPIL